MNCNSKESCFRLCPQNQECSSSGRFQTGYQKSANLEEELLLEELDDELKLEEEEELLLLDDEEELELDEDDELEDDELSPRMFVSTTVMMIVTGMLVTKIPCKTIVVHHVFNILVH
jgi:hypothetical protein